MNASPCSPLPAASGPPGTRRTAAGHAPQRLEAGGIASLALVPQETVTLRVARGTAWITLEGRADDFLVPSGDTLTLRGPGLLVIEALETGLEYRQHLRREHRQS